MSNPTATPDEVVDLIEAPTATPTANALFEMNLIANRVVRLQRRQHLIELTRALTIVTLCLGGLVGAVTVAHLTEYGRSQIGIRRLVGELKSQQDICMKLDEQGLKTSAQLAPVTPLLPLSAQRIAWAPKLVELATALPDGAGMQSVQISSGSVFAAPAPAASGKGVVQKASEPPSLKFAVMCPRETLSDRDPIDLVGRLRRSHEFMERMAAVRLDATEEGEWGKVPVVILRGVCDGSAELK